MNRINIRSIWCRVWRIYSTTILCLHAADSVYKIYHFKYSNSFIDIPPLCWLDLSPTLELTLSGYNCELGAASPSHWHFHTEQYGAWANKIWRRGSFENHWNLTHLKWLIMKEIITNKHGRLRRQEIIILWEID